MLTYTTEQEIQEYSFSYFWGLFYEFAQTSTISNTIKAVRTMPTSLKYFTFTLS